MRKVLITGVTGTLGQALAKKYRDEGYKVIGVTRHAQSRPLYCDIVLVNAQSTYADAVELWAQDADMMILNAGQIETDTDIGGMPLSNIATQVNQVNYLFPTEVILAGSRSAAKRRVDVIVIGSIADGSPSCFGPIYHASKAAAHQIVTAVGPILHSLNDNIRVRLYRPGVIYGPLSWAPVLRMNENAYKIRAARCRKAPDASVVAERIYNFGISNTWIGSDRSPISFHILKLFFAICPDLYYKLQIWVWRKGGRFVSLETKTQATREVLPTT